MSEVESLWKYLNSIIEGGEITLRRWDVNLPVDLNAVVRKIYGSVSSITLYDVSLSAQEEEEMIIIASACPSLFCEEIMDQTEVHIAMTGIRGGSGWGRRWEIFWRNTYAGEAGGVQWLNRWPGYPSMQVREGLFVYGAPVLEGSVVVSYECMADTEATWKHAKAMVKVVLDMAGTELFQKYSQFFGDCSIMTFTAQLPGAIGEEGIITAFISDPFETHFLFPVFAGGSGEPVPVYSAEMRVVIKTAVYDQMSVANWADDSAKDLVSAAWFVFALEAPESHGFASLSMEAFSEDESGCIDFYAEKGIFSEDENGYVEILTKQNHPWDMSLVTEVFGPALAVQIDEKIQETGDVLPSAARLLHLRKATKVCNLTFRFGLGENPGEFIRQSTFMDIRLDSRGEHIFSSMASHFHTAMDLISGFFHIEIVFRGEEPGAAVCCSVRNLIELDGGSSLFFDSFDGDFSMGIPRRCPLSDFDFPELEFAPKKAEYDSAGTEGTTEEEIEENRNETIKEGVKESTLTVEDFTLQGNFRTRNVYAALALSMENIMKLSIGSLSLELKGITAYISIQEQDMGFGIEGLAEIRLTAGERAVLAVSDDTDCFALSVGGSYEQSQWSMYASLAYGRITLAGLIRRIAGIQIPDGYDLQITKLSAAFQSEKGYRAECELDGTIPVLDLELKVGAQIEDWKPQPKKVQLYGQLSLLGFLFTARVELMQGSSRLFFELAFDGADLIAEVQGNQIVVTIKEISVGALIRAFYRIIRPNVDYSLPDPWSLLNQVGLSGVVITFDKENQVVTVVKELNINLLVARIIGIGFQYVWDETDPDRERFEIILRTDEKSGQDLLERNSLWGTEVEPHRGFVWDALHENAPVLFQGGEVFALHYFALGRNVFLGKVDKDGKLRDILAQLRQNLSNQKAGYDPETGWMICADVTVAKCLSLCLLIYDPWIYGAQITVESDAAAGLKGLDLTLYYRKVTDAIGVFYLHAQLPDAIRKVDLGGLAFTLPVIEVWLYTNGDFKVNLGFPENRDFSRSFAFSYGIYSGSGGLYLGKLSGDTSSKVPKIVNGYFTPVIEIGIGLKFGVGKSLDLGILKLRACLEIMGIFEGVFAVFRPKEERQEEALYYKCTALVEVSAELSGTVDFFVIKAGFHIYARVQVMVTLEAHEPALIGFEAELSVKAYLKILFITVKFSFSFTYRDSFLLGEKSAAPWIVEQTDALPVGVMAQVMNRRADWGQRRGLRDEKGLWDSWDVRAPFEVQEHLTCLVTPYFTAKQIRLWEKESEQDSAGESENQDTRRERDGWQTVILSTLTKESFESLVKGLARRALYAASGGKDSVTLGQLYELRGTLGEARNTVFEIAVLERFLRSAFRVGLCVPAKDAWDGQMEDGAVMPLFPQLVLTWYAREAQELVPVTQVALMEHHPLSDAQIADMRAYFGHFETKAGQTFPDWERRTEAEPGQEKGAGVIVFEDYCFMLTRQCVLDVIRKMEEEIGAVSYREVEEALDREYSVTALSDALSFAQYRGMGNRFLLGGARLPLSVEEAQEKRTVFWPLYGLMGVMFDSVPEETAADSKEPLHRLEITKNTDFDCSWIDFAYGGLQEERLYVVQDEERVTAKEQLVLDILKGELEYPDRELAVSFARKPAQLPNVRQEKVPLPLKAGRRLYYDGGEAELWQLPLPAARLGEEVRLGFEEKGNLAKGVRTTADFVFGMTISFELLREESYVNCVAINRVPEESLTLLQQAKDFAWEQAALLLPSPVRDNHGKDPVTDRARNQALSLLRCNLSTRTNPAPEGERTAGREATDGWETQMETFASITSLQAFLSLLLEMGKVGGKGQYLLFGVNPPDASYYGEDGTCQVELLLICGSKQRRDGINGILFRRPEGVCGEPLLCGEGIPSRPVIVMKQGVAGFSFSLRDPDEEEITDKERRTRQAFSLLNYRKEADPVLGGAYDSMPVSMQAGAEGEWEYRATLAVYRFGEEETTGSLPPVWENPYKGVLEPGEINLSLFFTDVCGNPAFGVDGGGLPLRLDLLYTDELIGISAWPDTSFSYQIEGTGNGKLLFRILAEFGDDKSRRAFLAGEESRPDRERCALLYYQLHQPDTGLALQFTLSGEEEIRPGEALLTMLRDYSAALYTYACGGSRPEGIRYEMELPKAPAVKRPRLVRAQLAIFRDGRRVQKEAPLPMGERAVSELPPYQDFPWFCEQLESALCEETFCVKLARGRDGLYAVYFGQGGCLLQVGIQETRDGLFSQKPVSLRLMNREGVSVVHLDDRVEQRSFYGVDLDLWLSRFLQDLEFVLSAGRLEALVTDSECLQILALLAKIKRGLAQELPGRTKGLFGEADRGLLEDVRYALCEELAEDLSKASRIAGIMAYPRKDWEDTMHFILSSQRADVNLQKVERGRAAVVFAMPAQQKAQKEVALAGTDAVFTHAELPGEGWFSFVRPFPNVDPYGKITLEQDEQGNPVSIPVVVREYPDIPVLIHQHGKMEDGASLTSLTWHYLAKMRLRPAAQDRIYIRIIVNGENLAAGHNRTEDLFDALARYDTVRGEILAALETPSMRKKALEAFRELALSVRDHLNEETVEQDLVQETLLLQAVYAGERIVKYLLQWESGQPLPGGFPVLTVTDDGGNRAEMRPEEATGGRAVYSLEAFPMVQVDFRQAAAYELLFEKLPLKQVQAMSLQVSSTRNEAFDLPGYGALKVSPDFVYRTEDVSFPQMVSPLGSYEDQVDLGEYSGERCREVFAGLAKQFQLQLAVYLQQILYEAAGTPVTADFPICFGVKRDMDEAELSAFFGVVDEWLRELGQRDGRERIRVSVQCYSRELTQERLLLEWKNLVFELG